MTELEAVVGFGMGGQQVYYWMCMQSDLVKNGVVICSSARTSPFNHMLLQEIQAVLLASVSNEAPTSSRQQSKLGKIHTRTEE